MPELPEVEHAARTLRAWLGGRTIRRARAADTRLFRGGSPGDFERLLPGRRLERIDRRGKYLLLSFDDNLGLLSHLGMTGKWVRRVPSPLTGRRPVPRHSHAHLVLDDDSALHYVDPRLFGQLVLVRGAVSDLPVIRALGPDAVLDGVDAARLHAVLARSARAVKVALLDQSVLAGVGNIYATEALFHAGVHPARPSRSLTLEETTRLAEGVRVVLDLSIAGMSVDEEIAYLSQGRGAENRFVIYNHVGAPCPRCGRALESMVLGGRSSAFCPGCQR